MKKKIDHLILALNKIGTSIIIFENNFKNNSIKFNKKYNIENNSLVEIQKEVL